MPTRSVFTGLRLQFLEGELEKFADAVAKGTKDDYKMDVIRRYFKRFPPDLPHDKEPSKEELDAVDDSLPDPELVQPLAEDYPEDQSRFYALEELWNRRQPIIKQRKDQISRWLDYQHSKRQGADASDDARDFATIMRYRLLGKEFKKPRKSSAYHVWLRNAANKALVDAAYASAVKPLGGLFNLRMHTAHGQQIYSQLPSDVRVMTEKLAIKEHEDKVQAWRKVLKFDTSKDPKARQECIDRISSVLQPIFDLVVECTGMHVTYMMGGPEPADHGRLNIISLHAGHTKGAVQMNFGQAEAECFERQVVPVFSNFLRKCFTREDCKAASLSDGSASIFSIVGANDIGYCPAAGDNYGPLDDLSSKPSDATKSKKKSPKAASHLENPSTDNQRGDAETETAQRDPPNLASDARGSFNRRGTSTGLKKPLAGLEPTRQASKKVPPAGKQSSVVASQLEPEAQDGRLGQEDGPPHRTLPTSPHQQHDLPFATPVTSERHSRTSEYLSSPIEQFSSPVNGNLVASRQSSPAPDHLVLSPPSSHPPSPISIPRDERPFEKNSTAAAIGSASASPLRRCGPPGRRNGDSNRKWRIRGSGTSAPGQLPLQQPPSSNVSPMVRIPTPAARTLVPTIHGNGPEFSNKFLEPLPEAAAITRNIAKRMFSRTNPSIESSGTAPTNATSSTRSKRRLETVQGTEEVEADEGVKRRRMDAEKENTKVDGIQNDRGEITMPTRKRKSGDLLEEVAPKRRKAISAPRMTTGSRPLKTLASTSAFAQWVLPAEASDAIKQTLQLLRFGCWGLDWEKLVTTWLAFELPRGYPADQRLSNKHRPPAVAEWIQRARAPSYRPKYKANEYSMLFWKWWIGLQPKWREIEADTTSREVDGDWDALDKAGANGLASVMAALCFWGFAVEEDDVGGSHASWVSAVKDVCWVLKQLGGSK